MMKKCKKINLKEPQRNRNATANFVNLIRTSTVASSAQTHFAPKHFALGRIWSIYPLNQLSIYGSNILEDKENTSGYSTGPY